MYLASESPYNDVSPIKTGTFIDKLSGIGGFPKRKMTEVWGAESVGKSTVCFQAIAQAQADGMRCLFVDAEWGYDTAYAESLGVDNTKLGLIQEELAEDILNEIEKEIKSDKWDLVVLDSVGALYSRSESEKEAGEKTIASQAGLVAKFCRKIIPQIVLHNVAFVVINHGFIDLMTGVNKPSGGQKLAYHKSFSVRLRVNTKKAVMQGDRKVGKVIIGIVTKNKLSKTEGLELESTIIFGDGFSTAQDLLGDAIEKGIFTKSGNTFFLGETKLGMISKVREWLKEPENAELIKARLA